MKKKVHFQDYPEITIISSRDASSKQKSTKKKQSFKKKNKDTFSSHKENRQLSNQCISKNRYEEKDKNEAIFEKEGIVSLNDGDPPYALLYKIYDDISFDSFESLPQDIASFRPSFTDYFERNTSYSAKLLFERQIQLSNTDLDDEMKRYHEIIVLISLKVSLPQGEIKFTKIH